MNKTFTKPLRIFFLQSVIVFGGTGLSVLPSSASLQEQTHLAQSGGSPATKQAEEENSRAAVLKKRRQQKAQNFTPAKTSGLEKQLINLEKKGISELLAVRWHDIYPKVGYIGPGSGISLGARYFQANLGQKDIRVDASAAFSFTGYRQAVFRMGRFNKPAPYLFVGPAAFGAPFQFGAEQHHRVKFFIYPEIRYRYFPREDFYGLGPDSSENNKSDYLLEDSIFDLVTGYQFNDWLGTGFRFGYLRTDTGRGNDDDIPDSGAVFPPNEILGFGKRIDYVEVGTGLFADYSDIPGNPHKGGVAGFSFERFDQTDGSLYDFSRYTLDVRQYLPLGSRQRILALHLFGSSARVGDGRVVPFYLQRTLGGNEMLRGFPEFRFRDTQLIYMSGEYRWEATAAVEFALF